MPAQRYIWGTASLCILALLGLGGWIITLPATTGAAQAPEVPQTEVAAMTAALRHNTPTRPLIAVIGLNDATETTDYLLPVGILRRAGIAQVKMLAIAEGPVQLYPALRVQPDATIAEFDAAYPKGADYVIVPAMSRDDDPLIIGWLQAQSDKGAVIIGICAGAKVIGAAGLLDHRRATTHWYYLDEMLTRSLGVRHVPDRRMVADGRIITTTGISASMPMMLTLIEAIAGKARAKAVAQDLGIDSWNARHASSSFRLTRPFAMTILRNRLAFWRHEDLGIPLQAGVDEVSLALAADGWSRTYRSTARAYASASGGTITANGIRILSDQIARDWPSGRRVLINPDRKPADTLDDMLEAITRRYDEATSAVVAMQLEYPVTDKAVP